MCVCVCMLLLMRYDIDNGLLFRMALNHIIIALLLLLTFKCLSVVFWLIHFYFWSHWVFIPAQGLSAAVVSRRCSLLAEHRLQGA